MRPKRIAKFIVMAIVAIGLFGLIVMSLWNWLMPPVFSLHTITYWAGPRLADPGQDLLRRASAAVRAGCAGT